MSSHGRLALLMTMLLAFPVCSPGAVTLTSAPGPDDKPVQIETGDVLFLTVQADPDVTGMTALYREKQTPFFRLDPTDRYGALIGIDLAAQPAREEISVQMHRGSGPPRIEQYALDIRPAAFGIQKLTLPKDKVDLDAETLKRVRAEQRRMLKSMRDVTPEQIWAGNFIMPVEGPIAGSFGRRRIINGEPRNPHTGEDIYVPQGTPVLSSNGGVVKLTGDFFFSGKSIVIDHGLGLFTMYFHLSEIQVREGDRVEKGQKIGRVGSTGRVTGPHLHWGVRLNGARVNPLSLVNLPLGEYAAE